MMSKSKVPQIRFKGFSGEWEESKLNEKAFITMGQSPVSSSYNENSIGLPLIQGNADCKERKTSPRISASQFTKECFINDIVMTVRAPVGYVSKSLHHACIGRGVCSIKSKEDGEFLFQFLINYENQWLKFSQGSTFTAVNSDDIKNLNLIIPNHNEQTKIGDYFQKLDKLIEQKEKKYQKLKQFKKAMLDKMFPKNGADTPEIRFKGFSGKWESKELGTIMDVTSVKRIHQSDWTNSGIRFLRARDIVADYKKEDISDYLYISEEKYNQYSLISGKVKQNDLLVTGVGTIGIPMLIKNDKPIYFKDGNIIWFKNENYLDGYFFYYSFINKTIQNYIKLSAGTGTVGTYTIESGKKTPIKIPKKAEQTKIGNYFQKLDFQIDLQQKELEKLKNIKKASLAKMFV